MKWLRRTALLVTSLAPLLPLTIAGSAGADEASRSQLARVTARAETASNFDDEAGGFRDADDPAIWVHRSRPADSVVVGTLKDGGLTVFDLAGRRLQHVSAPSAPTPEAAAGRFNNVDILQRVSIGGRQLDIAVVTDRGRDRLRIYRIDPRGAAAGSAVLKDLTVARAPRLFSASELEVEDQRTGYGLALRADPHGGAPWVTVSQRSETRVGLFRLVPAGRGRLSYRKADTLDLPARFRLPNGGVWLPCQEEAGEGPDVEGMVVDRRHDVLYAGQENVGIWRIPLLRGRFGTPRLVDPVREYGVPLRYGEDTEECTPVGPDPGFGGKHLSADVEGLTIAYRGGRATLIACSQGDDTLALYRLRSRPTFISSLRVAPGSATDGAEECDGAAVTTRALGPRYPGGLLVVHDGQNTPVITDDEGEQRSNTNFKLVSWADVLDAVRASR